LDRSAREKILSANVCAGLRLIKSLVNPVIASEPPSAEPFNPEPGTFEPAVIL
jgi:hypothetical protein